MKEDICGVCGKEELDKDLCEGGSLMEWIDCDVCHQCTETSYSADLDKSNSQAVKVFDFLLKPFSNGHHIHSDRYFTGTEALQDGCVRLHLLENSESESSESEEALDLEDENDESASLVSGKMNILYSHGSFFLWDAEDVQMLREECRIVGKLVGCLPRAPRQNIQLGLPLQLMPEEAKLLVDIDQEDYLGLKNTFLASGKGRPPDLPQHLRDGCVTQRLLVQLFYLKEEGSKPWTQTSENNTYADNVRRTAILLQSEASVATGNAKKVIEIVANHIFDYQFSESLPCAQSCLNMNIEDFCDTDLVLRILNQVCSECATVTLRQLQDFIIGDFSKEGDPARYHSHYIAVCKGQFDEMPCLDLVSLGRLSSNVRKTALLCALDRNRKVTYTSFTWTGIS
ncbi:hypothetical protein RRG08_013734 [Elysia crispata]|uniref:tRNA-intron lyase n=1 Tax=Elysia crispata TaxID=231223 RepID=A0AAE1DJU6_9GAST|nr:hypothetical protein RRG08_013734 [Elysia crispata]